MKMRSLLAVIVVFGFLLHFSPQNVEAEGAILYQVGDRDDSIIDIKHKLNWLGYGNIQVTNYYGTFTETKVKEFQDDYSLEVSGNVDQLTLDKLNEVLTSVFQEGNPRHEGIIDLKKALNKLGFGNITVTDYYGSFTTKKVSDFQEYYGLPVTGNADIETLKKVTQLLETPFQVGKRHSDTIKYKEYLNRLGFGNILVTNYYGDFTDKKVKEFQRYYGLVDNGIIDDRTSAKLNEVMNSPYQEGNRHEDLIDIKKKLNRLGFGNITVTTLFGSFTEKKVKEFQSYYGLAENGIVDEVTLAKLNSLMANGFKQGDRNKGMLNLKKDLNKLGFGKITVTTYFGTFAEKKVKEFQQYYGLPVTGVVDEATFDKIDEVLANPYRQGQRNDDLLELKNKLNWLGYGKILVTNYYGSFTTQKVKEFQKAYNLPESGIIEPKTLSKLNQVFNSTFQKGARHSSLLDFKRNLNKLGFNGISVTTYFGEYTEKKVKEFQEYYGLEVTGKGDVSTLTKMDELLASPFQKGKRHNDTIELKKMLNTIGYGKISVTNYFGAFTEEKLKEFQRDFKLPVSGIADEYTWAKLEEVFANKEITTYTNYNYTLSEVLKKQLATNPQTDLNMNDPAYIHSSYVKLDSSDYISGTIVNVRTSPKFPGAGEQDNVAVQLLFGATVKIKEEVTGDLFSGSTKWYRIAYNNNDQLYVHSSLVTKGGNTGTTTATLGLNVRSEPDSSSHKFGSLPNGTKVTIKKTVGNWYEIYYYTWRNAKPSDVEKYLNPANGNKYQHLVLSGKLGLKAADINLVLPKETGNPLTGTGSSFIEAAKTYNVNEAYLVTHVLHETGHGTSTLAKGQEVGLDSNGKIQLVTSENRSKLKNIKKVYNMYGIGAYDNNPNMGGAWLAYKSEPAWTSPELAIIGGAKWIATNYINRGQDTLYKMKWNPDAPATHQYATDIGWAIKQAANLQNIYKNYPQLSLRFEIPVYK